MAGTQVHRRFNNSNRWLYELCLHWQAVSSYDPRGNWCSWESGAWESVFIFRSPLKYPPSLTCRHSCIPRGLFDPSHYVHVDIRKGNLSFYDHRAHQFRHKCRLYSLHLVLPEMYVIPLASGTSQSNVEFAARTQITAAPLSCATIPRCRRVTSSRGASYSTCDATRRQCNATRRQADYRTSC